MNQHYSNSYFAKSLYRFIKPYRGTFAVSITLRFVAEVFGLYPAFALASIATFFSEYFPGQSLYPFWVIMGIWFATSFCRFVVRHYSNYWGYQAARTIALDAQYKAIEHLFRLDIAWHEKENAGNKLKRIDRGAYGLEDMIRRCINTFIGIAVNLVGVIIILAKFDRAIALWTVGFLVTYFIVSYFYTLKATQASRALNVVEEDMSGLLFEVVNNIRSAKAMSMATPILQIVAKKSSLIFEKMKARIFWFQSSTTVKNMWSQLFQLAILTIIAIGITQGKYEVGFIILFYNYFGNILTAITELTESAQEVAVAKYSIGRMVDLLDVPVTIDSEEGKVPFPHDWKEIVLSNVSFSYHDKKVLDSVSFTIKRGEKIEING